MGKVKKKTLYNIEEQMQKATMKAFYNEQKANKARKESTRNAYLKKSNQYSEQVSKKAHELFRLEEKYERQHHK
jgi:hypothetical protein